MLVEPALAAAWKTWAAKTLAETIEVALAEVVDGNGRQPGFDGPL
jgi:hypothetical protein